MKILLVHYRYYEWGGPERYLFNVTRALTRRGHEVIPFSIAHPDNQETPYATKFAPQVGAGDAKLFAEESRSPLFVLRKLQRTFYSKAVEDQMLRLIDETSPDCVYVLQFLRHLSPAVLVAAKRRSLPLVVRLSDFEIVCPQAHLQRAGRECRECIERNSIWPSVKYSCVRGSRALSLVNFAATQYHRVRKYFDLVDRFVAPSETMRAAMIAGGISASRLVHIPTPVESTCAEAPPGDIAGRPHVAYVGQLRPEKGVDLLIRAWRDVADEAKEHRVTLQIAGSGSAPYETSLRELAAGIGSIHFLGAVGKPKVSELLRLARTTIIPSTWPENLPNVLIESYAAGTPVVASAIGSLAEYVRDGHTGYLFPAGDADALASRLGSVIRGDANLTVMGANALRCANEEFSPEAHVQALVSVFRGLATSTSAPAPGVVTTLEQSESTNVWI